MVDSAAVSQAASVQGWMSRAELSFLHETAKQLPAGSTWVEVGTWAGRSASVVLAGLQGGSRAILVDGYPPEAGNKSAEQIQQAIATAGRVIADARSRNRQLQVSWHFASSLEAAAMVLDGSCDVVFIDATHTYEAVKADMAAWWSKLKPGGLFCGHDYSPYWPGVRQAVQEFVNGRWPVHVVDAIWHFRRPS